MLSKTVNTYILLPKQTKKKKSHDEVPPFISNQQLQKAIWIASSNAFNQQNLVIISFFSNFYENL